MTETWYISMRTPHSSGAVTPPTVFSGSPGTGPVQLRLRSTAELLTAIDGGDVLFGTHGFNVDFRSGAVGMHVLDEVLAVAGSALFVGILWPGDFWLPVVNYPFEAPVAVDCGRRLAAFCNRELTGAKSLSFISHSLGARVVLEAVQRLTRRTRMLCLTAAAVDSDCLTARYRDARDRCDLTYVLASRQDLVLRFAYPAGDFFSDVFGDGDSPFGSALGRSGSRPDPGVRVRQQMTRKADNIDHGDYLPTLPLTPKTRLTTDFMRRAVHGAPAQWP